MTTFRRASRLSAVTVLDPRPLLLATLALATLALAQLGCAAAAAEAPGLVIQAPPELAREARRLEDLPPALVARAAALAGAPAGGAPIRVALVPESSEMARRAPAWLAGFAESEHSLVVLFPGRVPLYPDRSLEQLLLHELAHVWIDRAAGYRPVPRWFHEGLALVAGGPWDLRDRSQLTLAMLRESESDLAALDRRFADPGELADAYAIAGALVRDLLQRHGADLPARLLAEMRGGEGFESAFHRVAGEASAAAHRSFWRRYAFWYRWVPLLTSSTTLWLAVTLLALAAIRRRRRRDAERLARWDALEDGEHDQA